MWLTNNTDLSGSTYGNKNYGIIGSIDNQIINYDTSGSNYYKNYDTSGSNYYKNYDTSGSNYYKNYDTSGSNYTINGMCGIEFLSEDNIFIKISSEEILNYKYTNNSLSNKFDYMIDEQIDLTHELIEKIRKLSVEKIRKLSVEKITRKSNKNSGIKVDYRLSTISI